ncbi:MAG: hypothetical protein ACKO5L_05290, partial [Bacteroidota bacterium]
RERLVFIDGRMSTLGVEHLTTRGHEGGPSASLFLKSLRLIPYLCPHLFFHERLTFQTRSHPLPIH